MWSPQRSSRCRRMSLRHIRFEEGGQMAYIYDDGDNAPMTEEMWEAQRKRWKEEPLPFTDPPEEVVNEEPRLP